jgi:uncharacterized protein (UPF0303 family)
MNASQDLDRLVLQERLLHFKQFDGNTAWALGSRIKALAEAAGTPVTVEIRVGGHLVFFHAMAGTQPANADWARRKRNTVELMQRSSYRVGRELARDNTSLETMMGLPTRDYCAHGGGVPLHVAGAGVVGVVTVSGLPERDDHNMAVVAIAELCGVPLADVALG